MTLMQQVLGIFAPLSALLIQSVSAVTREYNLTVGWVQASPDGISRQVIGINGQWPIPTLQFTRGDRAVIHVRNSLPDRDTSLHFHGILQRGSAEMDGAVGTTQCGIPPGMTFTYEFVLDQVGTYWYHSHSKAQYPDGLRGMLIVTDPNPPFHYDGHVPLSVSDWYNDSMDTLLGLYLNTANPDGVEPIPEILLLNDDGASRTTFQVVPKKTYYFQLANVGAFANIFLWMERHTMRIVEIDGVYVDARETKLLYIAPGQRYGFLVTMSEDPGSNYPIGVAFDTDVFDNVPNYVTRNTTGWLVYDQSKPLPSLSAMPAAESVVDDATLVSSDKQPLLTPVDRSIMLRIDMQLASNGASYGFLNNVSYTPPKVPGLYTALSSGPLANVDHVYGDYTNTFLIRSGQNVEVIINNFDDGEHPIHIHGHELQIVKRGPGEYDPRNKSKNLPIVPARRDTVIVEPLSHLVLRFRADNPGVWFFHCHINWHLDGGLAGAFVEAPVLAQNLLHVPRDHLDACRAMQVPTKGNAAGNSKNPLDLTGQDKGIN